MLIPRLHPDTIEEVKQRADIIDVISEHVVLRKRGKDFLGLCPFHEEKSPSFTVSPSKQMYYCFGCQAGGNVVTFLKEFGKRTFTDVVLDLARRYQVQLKTLEPEQREELQRQISTREQLYEILASATAFYQHALRQSLGAHALEYLKSQRQFNEETIQQFQLGYAPAGWETLHGYLVEQKHYSVQMVEKAGLIKSRKSGDGYIDQFRDRLIIPIRDTQGKVIGFGGRTLTDEQPKYLNSPETELFDKGKTLFALDLAKTAISQQDRAVVVEGYFDAIALHEAGIHNVVASLGTALSLNQVRQILRYTDSKQIVLNFDADKAGTQATERAIGEIGKLAYTGEVQLRILNLPDGKDADEFVKNSGSSEQYQELITTAPLWIDWQIQQILINKDLKQADHYQLVTKQLVNLLTNITNDAPLTHYINYCSEILSQGDSRRMQLLAENLISQIVSSWESRLNEDSSIQLPLLIQNRLKGYRPNLRNKVTSKQLKPSELTNTSELEKAEALLLRLYLHCPQHRQTVITTLETKKLIFSLSHHRLLWQQILYIESLQPGLTSGDEIISKLQDLYIEYPEQLGQISHLFYLDELTQRDILRASELINYTAAAIERVICEKKARQFLQLWQQIDATIEPDRWQKFAQEFYQIKQRIKDLDRELQFCYFFR